MRSIGFPDRRNIDMVCKRIGDAVAVRSKIGTQQKADTPSDSIAASESCGWIIREKERAQQK